MEINEIYKKLSAEFTTVGPDGKVYPAHKWKTLTTKGEFAICVPYIDARQVSDRLNEVLNLDGWEGKHVEMMGESIQYDLTIFVSDKKISRSDVGTYTEYQKDKGRASDALKRAAVHFGVGAYLYKMEPVKLKKVKGSDGKIYPATDEGHALITGDALTSYINMKHPLRAKLVEIYNSFTKEQQKQHENNFTEIWETLQIK